MQNTTPGLAQPEASLDPIHDLISGIERLATLVEIAVRIASRDVNVARRPALDRFANAVAELHAAMGDMRVFEDVPTTQ